MNRPRSLGDERRRAFHQSTQTRQVTGTTAIDQLPRFSGVRGKHERVTIREHALCRHSEVRDHELSQVRSLGINARSISARSSLVVRTSSRSPRNRVAI